MRRGFTLVELSIVLVIIGLLISGILVAQSMISTVKVTAQVSQIQQFDAAVMNHLTKYNGLPGDARSRNGNGDGMVARACCGFWLAGYYDEMTRFWNHAFPDDFSLGTNVDNSAQAIYTGTSKNVPLSKIGKRNSFVIASALSSNGQHADPTLSRNYYAILEGSQLQTLSSGEYRLVASTATISAVSPAELLSLDTKLDDGSGTTGNVLSGRTNTAVVHQTLATCSNSVTGIYTTSNSGFECTPLIRIGAQAGDPQ